MITPALSVLQSMTDWDDKIENCDPRVKWAMEVMDQEGEVFEGLIGKVASLCFSWMAYSFPSCR